MLFTWGTQPMNIPTKNLKIRNQMKDEAIAVNMPYQNKKNVAHSNVGRRPNLSAIIPHSGEPSIIPKNNTSIYIMRPLILKYVFSYT